jgi:hypothetical protein
MPKHADDKLYLNPAIPRHSRLAEYLEESSARTGIPKSQLLVWFAAEYVRLVVDGTSVVPATPVPIAPPTASSSEPMETQGSIRTLGSITQGDDTNYDSVFGDPD